MGSGKFRLFHLESSCWPSSDWIMCGRWWVFRFPWERSRCSCANQDVAVGSFRKTKMALLDSCFCCSLAMASGFFAVYLLVSVPIFYGSAPIVRAGIGRPLKKWGKRCCEGIPSLPSSAEEASHTHDARFLFQSALNQKFAMLTVSHIAAGIFNETRRKLPRFLRSILHRRSYAFSQHTLSPVPALH